MHVMHVIDSMHGGGAETSLLDVVPALARHGVRISVVTLRADDGSLEGRIDHLALERIRLRRRDPLGAALELRHIVRSEQPDLLHTTLFFSNLAGRIVARTVGIPVVTTLANQDYGPEHQRNSRYGVWSVRAVHAADMLTVPLTVRFHAISADVERVMSRRLRIPRDRIQVVYRGRDPARLGQPSPARRQRTRMALSIDSTTPVVLSAGRLDRQKGTDKTIEAFRLVSEKLPDAILLIAGRPGNASAVVQAKAEGHPAIRLLGHRADVTDLMCAADVLSFPSRWEGLGGTLIEALALRLAIVASDIPPVAETVGDVGWPLVPPDDELALSEALVSMLSLGAAGEARKDAGEARFREFFTADAAAEGMARFYAEVLSDAKRAGGRAASAHLPAERFL
jgi:glycosyltransferase involved in cell wall biosynthesis